MSYFSVKNYEQFQHYKDRSPPWIKFYNSVLDDYAFTSLPDASRSHLVAIWLLASRTGNRIPYDADWVRMAIKATTKVDLSILEKAGFIIVEQDCSETLADRKQDARPERETEKRQSREEREEDKSAPDGARTVREPLVAILGEELADGVIDHRKRLRKPLTPLAAKLLAGKFQSCPDPPAAAQAMIANGWQGIEPSWMKHDKPSDLQRRTSLAREFLTLPAGGTETGGG